MTTAAPPKAKSHPFSANRAMARDLGICWHSTTGERWPCLPPPPPPSVPPAILCPSGHRHLPPVVDVSCWLDSDDVHEVQVTRREYEVAQELLRDGATNAQIGKRLFLTEDTIKSHLKKLLLRTATDTRTELVVAVFRGRIRLLPTPLIRSTDVSRRSTMDTDEL